MLRNHCTSTLDSKSLDAAATAVDHSDHAVQSDSGKSLSSLAQCLWIYWNTDASGDVEDDLQQQQQTTNGSITDVINIDAENCTAKSSGTSSIL